LCSSTARRAAAACSSVNVGALSSNSSLAVIPTILAPRGGGVQPTGRCFHGPETLLASGAVRRSHDGS
jgi:hypothetical protein